MSVAGLDLPHDCEKSSASYQWCREAGMRFRRMLIFEERGWC
jgi:hypothetical protein